ncbi:unnamed protein product [Amoebophrya sp. A120]|nr:unnamed protein product [Amoebophrya sp. A120]CAD7975580.1 unnamed protein product [Amoebophrya sp. A120]|eukprot:GSA120T00016210001.1
MKEWVRFLCFQEDAQMNKSSRSSRRNRRATTFSEMLQFLMFLRTRENKDLHCAVFCFGGKSRNVHVALGVCEANDNEDQQDVVYNNLPGKVSSSSSHDTAGTTVKCVADTRILFLIVQRTNKKNKLIYCCREFFFSNFENLLVLA